MKSKRCTVSWIFNCKWDKPIQQMASVAVVCINLPNASLSLPFHLGIYAGVSWNANCDDLVGFPKLGHIYIDIANNYMHFCTYTPYVAKHAVCFGYCALYGLNPTFIQLRISWLISYFVYLLLGRYVHEILTVHDSDRDGFEEVLFLVWSMWASSFSEDEKREYEGLTEPDSAIK